MNRRFQTCVGGAVALIGTGLTMGIATTSVAAASFSAGGFTFSDELGGFRLIAATGAGTRGNPIVIEEVLLSADPVVLVVRANWISDQGPVPVAPDFRTTAHLVKIIHNRSGRIWNGFDMELQEILNSPSRYEDGLSFGQASSRPSEALSNRYARARTVLEPHDRLHFDRGRVDVNETVTFSLHITDPTPVRVFYLVQDPQILFARKKGPETFIRFSLQGRP